MVPNHEKTNEKQNHTKVIEIPEELRRLYESQTGHEINSIYFREPGAHVDTSNTIREFVGSSSKEMSNTETETVFHFDFDHDYYEKQPIPGNNGDCENFLSYPTIKLLSSFMLLLITFSKLPKCQVKVAKRIRTKKKFIQRN